MEGERETREEVKCNRGFIVCSPFGEGAEQAGGKGGRTRGGDEKEGEQWEQCVGTGQNVRQPRSVRLQNPGGLPTK